tara:strand:+ start:279 stop:593 length:315 start_codon:yes stop_codon:yes gene_type:complete
MILYNVTISIDTNVEEEWLQWMKEVHIPDVMNTGLFIDNKICRIHAEEEGGKSYSIQYLAKSWNEYNQYKDTFSQKLQQEHTLKFSGKFAAFRTILEVVHHQTM